MLHTTRDTISSEGYLNNRPK